MKKTLLSTACFLLLSIATFAITPNEKVLKVFQSTFANPLDVTWFDHSDYYDVTFMQGSTRSSVKYDKEGNFISSIRYYGEQNLPVNVICLIRKKYADKNIFGVTELTNQEEVNYYIKLQDSKYWLTVKVSGNGHIQMVEKFRKA